MGILLIIFFAVLYGYTLAPTVLWGDSAKLSIYVKEVYLTFDPVGNHMLHTLFGRFFSLLPVGDFAYRQNLMSALFAIATLSIFYSMMCQILGDRKSAFLVSLVLGISHTFWLVSVVNESYIVSLFFFATGFFFLVKWEKTGGDFYLYFHCFLMGVSLLNNLLSGLMIPATFLFLLCFDKGRNWLRSFRGAAGFGYFLLGFSPLVIMAFLPAPTRWGGYGWFLRPKEIFSQSLFYPAYLFYQFPLLGFWFGGVGAKEMFRKKRCLFWAVLAVLVLDVLFASGYMRQRRFFLLLPSYFCYAVWIGFGLKKIIASQRDGKGRVLTTGSLILLIALPVGLYTALPEVARRYHIDFVRGRQLVFRDNNLFYLNPVKRDEWGPKEYGMKSLEVVKPGSLIIGDFTPAMVLLYYQKVEGLRPDVLITTSIDRYVKSPERRGELYQWIARELEKRPVYIADKEESYYGIEELKKRFDLVPQGPLWEVHHRGT